MSPLRGYSLGHVLGLGESYPTSPHDLKSVLSFKNYSIFSTKLVIKFQGMDLGKKLKKPSGEFLYLSFAVIRLKIKLIEKCEKTIAPNRLTQL